MDLFRSATFKLTTWYLSIVVVISLCFSAIVYRVATYELSNSLQNQTQRIYQEYPFFGNNSSFPHTTYSMGSWYILRDLIYFNIIVLVGAGFASYYLAKLTLRPIEQSLEQQKRFTADASHELRTPLTAIKMESEVVLADSHASKEDLRASLQSNLEETEKLENLINNLLRLSHVESQALQQSFRQINLQELAAEAADHLQSTADARDITIRRPETKLTVKGDHGSLLQAVIILLDNAVKYSKPGDTIEITVAKSSGYMTIAVKDQGSGISPEALEHVFERFYRADQARTHSSVTGYGLGLSTAKHIADLHSGVITITSKVGNGTTATLKLPQ